MSQGVRIKEARRYARMTQGELAEACGVSRAAVSLWENDETKELKSSNLAAVAKATGYSYDYLLKGTGQKTKTGTNILGGQNFTNGEEKIYIPDENGMIYESGTCEDENNLPEAPNFNSYDEREELLIELFRVLGKKQQLNVLIYCSKQVDIFLSEKARKQEIIRSVIDDLTANNVKKSIEKQKKSA